MIWGIVTAHPPMEGYEVDWKRLVQFALLGSSDLEQGGYPLHSPCPYMLCFGVNNLVTRNRSDAYSLLRESEEELASTS